MSTNEPMGASGPTEGQGPPPASGRSFFDSLRASGWYRANNRVLGGVCSGIAAHTGWDLGLVRALTVILGLFLPPVWIAYGIAWLLLPEQRDGRIHLEAFTLGHFDIAQLGAAAMIMGGLGNPFPWLFGSDRVGAYWVFCFAIIVIIAVIVIVAISRGADPKMPRSPRPQTPPSTPPPTSPMSGAASPPTEASTHARTGAHPSPTPRPSPTPHSPQQPWTASPGPVPQTPVWAASPAPGVPGAFGESGPAPRQTFQGHRQTGPIPPTTPQVRAWTPPVSAPIRKVSSPANLLVFGLVILIIAATLLFCTSYATSESAARASLIGGGLALLIIGIALAIASSKDRSAGLLTALSLVGIVIALPVSLAAGTLLSTDYTFDNVVSPGYSSTPSITSSSAFDWTATAIHGTDSTYESVNLDLAGAPTDTSKTIAIDGAPGPLDITVRQGQSVAVNIDGSSSSVSASYYMDASGRQLSQDWVPEVNNIGDSLFFRSDSWTPDAGITLEISSGTGPITITETAPTTPTPDPASPSPAASATPTTSSTRS